jgi:hypothetical protein
LADELIELASAHLDGHLPDQPGRTDLTFQMMAALVDQLGELFGRRQGQSGRTEDDEIEETLRR